jgi:hypothetical protein
MKTVKAKQHDDEPVTEDVLARAVDLGRKRRSTTLHAKGVRYLPEFEALAVSFADKAAVLLPVKKYAELARLSLAELGRIEVGFGGSALCLGERDLHVSIAGLVSASKPLMELASTVIAARNGSRSSAAKALAARENGQKGGRPRKLATAG